MLSFLVVERPISRTIHDVFTLFENPLHTHPMKQILMEILNILFFLNSSRLGHAVLRLIDYFDLLQLWLTLGQLQPRHNLSS
jgi:hypothetical protein